MSGMPSLGTWSRWRRRVAARLVHAAWRRVQRAGVVTAETAAGRRFAAFGPGSLVAFPTGTVFGERWIEIGDGTMLGEQVSVCAGMMPGHDLGSESVLRIGDRCVIGRGSHIVAHHSIDIGDDVYTGPYVYITDQNHSYADPELPIGRQWPVNAVVRGEIGDRCVVAGVPARVIKDFNPQTGWSRPAAGSLRADAAFRGTLAGDPALAEDPGLAGDPALAELLLGPAPSESLTVVAVPG